MTARAPIVRFTTAQVHVCWENTGVCWHARWTVATFFVWARLSQVNSLLLWEVADIVHSFYIPFVLSWAQNDWILQHDIAIVCAHLTASGTNRMKYKR